MTQDAAYSITLPTYAITVAPGSLDSLGEAVRAAAPAFRYAIITDENVAPRYARRAIRSFGGERVAVFEVGAGEGQKTRATWARLTDELLDAGFGRDSTIIALGGGVVGDLAGFVAATFMRGIPYVQVPTTLLAMIDSSIGGKTGVDTPTGKNLVGAFHQPAAVIVDPETLQTLPLEQLRGGLAEAIKHGVIADATYFERVVADLPALLERRSPEALHALITRSIEIKADVVRRDEREGGLRKILNFGHTLGHAIEAVSEYRVLHGESVAIGMALESELAERLGIAEAGTTGRLRDALRRAALPTVRPADLAPDQLLAATRGDKKARGGAVTYALPLRIGVMAGARQGWTLSVEDAAVVEVLR